MSVQVERRLRYADPSAGLQRDALGNPYASVVLGGAAQFFVARFAMAALMQKWLHPLYWSGGSAGAIAAALGAAGSTPEELRELAVNSDAMVQRLVRTGPWLNRFGLDGGGLYTLDPLEEALGLLLEGKGIRTRDDLPVDSSAPLPMGEDPNLWRCRLGIGVGVWVCQIDDADAELGDGRIDDAKARGRLIRKYLGFNKKGIYLDVEVPDEMRQVFPDLGRQEDFRMVNSTVVISGSLPVLGQVRCYLIENSKNPGKKLLYVVMDGSMIRNNLTRLTNGLEPNIPIVVGNLLQNNHDAEKYAKLVGGHENPYAMQIQYPRGRIEALAVDQIAGTLVGKIPFSALAGSIAEIEKIWATIFDDVISYMEPTYAKMHETLPQYWLRRVEEIDQRKILSALSQFHHGAGTFDSLTMRDSDQLRKMIEHPESDTQQSHVLGLPWGENSAVPTREKVSWLLNLVFLRPRDPELWDQLFGDFPVRESLRPKAAGQLRPHPTRGDVHLITGPGFNHTGPEKSPVDAATFVAMTRLLRLARLARGRIGSR